MSSGSAPTSGRADPLPRLFHGWYVAMAGAASNFLVIGIATFGFGVFIRPMREELGWAVGAISIGVSLRSFEQGLLAPLTGFLVDRVGPRRMAIFGLLLLGTGLLLFSQARTLPMFYGASMVMALGQSTASFTPFSVVVMAWFRRKRGRAMGILNTGNGAGYLATPVLALLIAALGWRSTLIVCAVVIVGIGLPLTRLLRDLPEDRGLMPDGDVAADFPGGLVPAQSGMTVREALRTPAFYLLVLAAASNGSQGAWIVHQVPHLESAGFTTAQAALLAGLYGLIQIGLRYFVGWLGDSVGRKRLYIWSYLLQGAGLVIFAYVTPERWWLLPMYYVVYALGHAAWVIFMQTIVADYFGTLRFASLRGFASVLQTPVGVFAPWFAGAMFDRTGNYVFAFTLFGIISATGALWVMLIRRPLWVEVEAARIEAARAASGVAPDSRAGGGPT